MDVTNVIERSPIRHGVRCLSASSRPGKLQQEHWRRTPRFPNQRSPNIFERYGKPSLFRREGKHVHYRADPGGLAPMADWLSFYGVFWRARFAALEKLLKEIDT